MTVLLGLGNPGPAYARTRHNAGFLALDRLAGNLGVVFRPDSSGLFDGAEAALPGDDVLLARPLTWMNRSGEAAAAIAGARACEPGRFLLIHDDVALPLGQIRIRAGGSSGGHKGVASVIEALGTTDVPRLRLGISGAPGAPGAPGAMTTSAAGGPGTPAPEAAPVREIRRYVLEDFDASEVPAMEEMIGRACDAARAAVALGIDRASALFNGQPSTRD